jgi:hypothetical protein
MKASHGRSFQGAAEGPTTTSLTSGSCAGPCAPTSQPTGSTGRVRLGVVLLDPGPPASRGSGWGLAATMSGDAEARLPRAVIVDTMIDAAEIASTIRRTTLGGSNLEPRCVARSESPTAITTYTRVVTSSHDKYAKPTNLSSGMIASPGAVSCTHVPKCDSDTDPT